MEVEEFSEADWAAVDGYMARRQDAVKAMVFASYMATCDRLLPLTGALAKGARFAVHSGDNQPRVLVEVIEDGGNLYFLLYSSRDEKIPCQPQDLVRVSVPSVYLGAKPKDTPPLPANKKDWENLKGRGSLKLRLWHLLCQFKKFCDHHYRTSQRKKG